MSYFNLPEHGDRTEGGVWFDSRPIDASSTWDDMLAAAHTPDCDVLGCDYGLMSFANQERDGRELTYHGGDGLWMCPTHWAEFYTYEPPRLTRLFDHDQLTTPA